MADDMQRQLLFGTFEHALNYLLDYKLNLTNFALPLLQPARRRSLRASPFIPEENAECLLLG